MPEKEILGMPIGEMIFNSLNVFIEQLTEYQEQKTTSSRLDGVYHEIQHIEQNLSKWSAQSSLSSSRTMKPLTEQQKIIDLAG